MEPLALIGVWFIGVLMIYVREVNNQLLDKQRQERELYAAQKKYYEVLLEKERDTRKYRHDMNNYLVCLTTLEENRDWEGLHTYLEGMQEQMLEIRSGTYHMGNDILNSLTSYFLGDLDKQIRVSVSGCLDQRSAIDPLGLSVIYSNLLKNAVEETNRCLQQKESEPQICVTLQNGDRTTQIEVENTLAAERDEGELPVSSAKERERNHGFGLENVGRQVERLEGQICFEKREKTFYVKVVLPHKTTV